MSAATKSSNGVAPSVAELNLDDLLGKIDVTPKPVRLGGRVYMVRRDLTAAEASTCIRLINEGKELEATALLVGDDAVALDATISALPRQHQLVASQHLLQVAGIMAGGDLGESPAS